MSRCMKKRLRVMPQALFYWSDALYLNYSWQAVPFQVLAKSCNSDDFLSVLPLDRSPNPCFPRAGSLLAKYLKKTLKQPAIATITITKVL